ncbi:argininosuccinate synthase [Aureibacter tunicatorum]|uniref:argininosuccinate synthase n=1 Tax=Aureibacter tunicatorum TaxID=866807 RepID=A0AAE4BSH2_9BACT|nr:argininosuccinate synthase domain-containing protein [Aureibacter tunicatorum]MDR6239756.1 argininosuccinate synthase [Aureibacter tunicatorum]BDD04232.1 argininosuccinate synthase [Aureibacter tunicatorum]
MKKKVVLAYSGGLDTSYCVKYLQDQNLDVYSAIVNTGGFDKEELQDIELKAYEMGVVKHKTLDVVEQFYQKCVKYLIFGNILKNNTYPLSVSAERIFQAIAIVKYAKSMNADYIAHGSTGAGNDQVRFDLVFNILAPEIEILTPIRDQQLSRQQEIEFLAKHGIEKDWKKAQYSINKGLWGTSVGGAETLTSNKTLPNSAYPSQLKSSDSKVIKLEFTNGQISGIDNVEYNNPVNAIIDLEKIASEYAIGRDIHVGDTIIGIKGRVGFEAAAPIILIKAHHLLEKHTLAKWQQHWKQQLGDWYGMLLHEGQYLDPVMRDIEAFLESTQKTVSGTVEIKLSPYQFELIGIDSPHDLMSSKFGEYGEMNSAWSGEDVKGFTKILANQTKIFHAVNQIDIEL